MPIMNVTGVVLGLLLSHLVAKATAVLGLLQYRNAVYRSDAFNYGRPCKADGKMSARVTTEFYCTGCALYIILTVHRGGF